MQKVRVLFLLLGLCWFFGQGAFLYAQNEDGEGESEDPGYGEDILDDEWDGYISDLYTGGDQTFTISAGVIFPLAFLNNGSAIKHNFNPPVGGTIGPLAYTYFLDSHFFVGGEVGFQFMYTLGQNTAFFIPFGLRAGWQFIVQRFEFPIHVTVGGVVHKYLDYDYFGLVLKGGFSGYFRFNPDWSFGLGTELSWYPQWPDENGKPAPQKNVDGLILGVTLAARYHF